MKNDLPKPGAVERLREVTELVKGQASDALIEALSVNETDCKITLDGQEFSANGAYVDEAFARVYVKTVGHPMSHSPITVTDWKGKELGKGKITSIWRMQTMDRMVQVRFTIGDKTYSGRFNYDAGELVFARRVKSKRG